LCRSGVQDQPGQGLGERHVDQLQCHRRIMLEPRRGRRGRSSTASTIGAPSDGEPAVLATLAGAAKSVNRTLEAKARALAGWKGYVTNLPEPSAEFLIGAYHRLFQIEASFRHVQTPPPRRPAVLPPQTRLDRGHLTIVFAALVVSRLSRTAPAGRSASGVMPQPQGREQGLDRLAHSEMSGVCCGYGHDGASTRWCTCGSIATPCPT
jgi:hypothetical protein